MLEYIEYIFNSLVERIHSIPPCHSDMAGFVTAMIPLLIAASTWETLRATALNAITAKVTKLFYPIYSIFKKDLSELETGWKINQSLRIFSYYVSKLSALLAFICSLIGLFELFFSFSSDWGVWNFYLLAPFALYIGVFLFIYILLWIAHKLLLFILFGYEICLIILGILIKISSKLKYTLILLVRKAVSVCKRCRDKTIAFYLSMKSKNRKKK